MERFLGGVRHPRAADSVLPDLIRDLAARATAGPALYGGGMSTVPHGSWPSPISAADLASGGVRLGEPRYDGADLYWTQGRPAEAGRVALLRERDGVVTEVAPGLSVRTRVHEYGGGAWDARNGVVVISSDPSGQLLRLDADGSYALTSEGSRQRFADLRVWPELGIVLAVREDHSAPDEPVNCLVVLRLDVTNADGGAVIAEGADFYACPELSRDGRLAWMEWRHPDMPWDACLIRTARLAVSSSGAVLDDVRTIAGGPGSPRSTRCGAALSCCSARTAPASGSCTRATDTPRRQRPPITSPSSPRRAPTWSNRSGCSDAAPTH